MSENRNSHAGSDPARELPKRAVTAGQRGRIAEPDDTGDNLSLDEAARRFQVSRATLRRRLNDGEIPGAVKGTSPRGAQWQIPLASLSKLYYHRSRPGADGEVASPQPPLPETAELARAVTRLAETLEAERRQLLAAEAVRADALVEAARLAGELQVTRRRVECLEAELDRARRSFE